MKAMWLTLCEWSSLKSLEIVGYCDGYQTLPAINSRSDRMPSYQLEEISFSDVEMRGRTLIEFLGANPRSLASLTLESIRYLANGVLSEVFRTVGSTLKFLTISSDLDEGSTDMYDPDILSPLVRLERFDLVSEDSFPQEVLETVCALPSIETVSVTVPAVSYGTATSALDESSRTLDTLSIEIWDSNLWEDGEVWAFAKACEARAVELFFNNMDHDDIEDGKSLPHEILTIVIISVLTSRIICFTSDRVVGHRFERRLENSRETRSSWQSQAQKSYVSVTIFRMVRGFWISPDDHA